MSTEIVVAVTGAMLFLPVNGYFLFSKENGHEKKRIEKIFGLKGYKNYRINKIPSYLNDLWACASAWIGGQRR